MVILASPRLSSALAKPRLNATMNIFYRGEHGRAFRFLLSHQVRCVRLGDRLYKKEEEDGLGITADQKMHSTQKLPQRNVYVNMLHRV